MMKLTQPWIGYLDRSYQQIKKSLLDRLINSTPEITDHSEGNPLIVLIGMFAAVGEMLNLYIDRTAQELFIGTARRYSSLIKIAQLLDYQVKPRTSASVDVVFTLQDTQNNVPLPNPGNTPIIIPDGTTLTSSGISFILQGDCQIEPGRTSARGKALQYTTQPGSVIGVSSGLPWLVIPLPEDYAHGTAQVLVASDVYEEYESFAYMLPTTKGFVVSVLEDEKAYLLFGDGFNGAIPTSGATVTLAYNSTVGSSGNILAHTITTSFTPSGLLQNSELLVDNPENGVGGSEIEGMADIRLRAPGMFSTKRRAVTKADYEDIALQAPGVGHAKVDYCCCSDCPSGINLYIAPKTTGIVTGQIIQDTEDYFSDKLLLGRSLKILKSGISRVYVSATLNGASGLSQNEILANVYAALYLEYSYNSSEINRVINLSDLYTTLNNVKGAVSLTIDGIYLEPYARPIIGVNKLGITFTGPIKANQEYKYRIEAVDDGLGGISYNIIRNGVFKDNIQANITYVSLDNNNNPILTLEITDPNGLNDDGDVWEFFVYPTYPEVFSNYQLLVKNFTVPIIDVDYTNLQPNGLPTVFGNFQVKTSTLNNDNCKGDC